jgi:peptidoglycan/xylan/chitin deacetylase (PgdA/CDA1 family)
MNYFKKYNFFHGVMFHHFHDNKIHYKGQGSIGADLLFKMIKYFGTKNILSPEDFINKYKNDKLKKNHVCFTFDDGLKCQYDIALPVLEHFKIKAFFFVNSINLSEKPMFLELFRVFRHLHYSKVDDFYDEFYRVLNYEKIEKFLKTKSKIIEKWKLKFPFYSYSDIKFRMLREYLLTNKQYENTMFKLFKEKKFNFKKKIKQIYLNKKDIKSLSSLNHNIGLHSHSHPTLMRKEIKSKQFYEYKKNKQILEDITKSKINSMAHPCGSYNNSTLRILKNLGLDIGFRSTTVVDMNMKKINNSKFEIAREDHINILKCISLI